MDIDAPELPGPQTDFVQLAQILQNMARELGNLENLPVIANSADYIDAIKALTAQVRGLSTQVAGLTTQVAGLNTQVEGLSTQVAGLSTQAQVAALDTRLTRDIGRLRTDMTQELAGVKQQLRIADQNSIARGLNAACFESGNTLTELRHHQSGAGIQSFPPTVQGLMDLNIRRAKSLLEALGQSTDGSLDILRNRAMKAVGVVAQIQRLG